MDKKRSPLRVAGSILRFIATWIICTIIFVAIASPINTYFVLTELIALDVPISSKMRIDTTVNDFKNMLPNAGMIFGIALFSALIVGRFIARRIPINRSLVLMVSCGVSVAATLEILKLPFDGVILIAGTRGLAGYLGFCVAGSIAGLVFSLLYPRFGRR